jgi:hypothetical protein
MIGWRTFAGTGGQTQALSYRYDYGADHVTFTTTLVRANDNAPWSVQGFNLAPSSEAEVSAPAQGDAVPIPPIRTKPADS